MKEALFSSDQNADADSSPVSHIKKLFRVFSPVHVKGHVNPKHLILLPNPVLNSQPHLTQRLTQLLTPSILKHFPKTSRKSRFSLLLLTPLYDSKVGGSQASVLRTFLFFPYAHSLDVFIQSPSLNTLHKPAITTWKAKRHPKLGMSQTGLLTSPLAPQEYFHPSYSTCQ